MPHYDSVLGIPWRSTKSDAHTDCYYTYVLEQSISRLADPDGPHRLDAHDLDDCRQVVYLHASRCLKYFDPSKSRISTFITRLIKQGVGNYLTEKYQSEQPLMFSEFQAATPHEFALATAVESDMIEVGGRLTAGHQKAKRRALSKYEQTRLESDSMKDPEDDDGDDDDADTTVDE